MEMDKTVQINLKKKISYRLHIMTSHSFNDLKDLLGYKFTIQLHICYFEKDYGKNITDDTSLKFIQRTIYRWIKDYFLLKAKKRRLIYLICNKTSEK